MIAAATRKLAGGRGRNDAPETPQAAPLLSVVKGEPSAEELAALTAVVLSLGGTDAEATGKPTVRHWVRRQQLAARADAGSRRLEAKPGLGSWGDYRNPIRRPSATPPSMPWRMTIPTRSSG